MKKKVITASRETWGRIFRAVRGVESLDRDSLIAEPSYRAGDDCDIVLCKTTAEWAKGTTATLQIWTGKPGSETNSGVTISAYNRYGVVKSGEWCSVALHRHGWHYLVAPAGAGNLILGKTNADWAVNSQATVPVWTGAPGAEADSGTTQVAYNRLCKVLSGKWVWLGAVNGNYYLVAVQMEQQIAVYNAKLTSTDLVFERKKFWAPTTEEGTDVLIPLDDCEA